MSRYLNKRREDRKHSLRCFECCAWMILGVPALAIIVLSLGVSDEFVKKLSAKIWFFMVCCKTGQNFVLESASKNRLCALEILVG